MPITKTSADLENMLDASVKSVFRQLRLEYPGLEIHPKRFQIRHRVIEADADILVVRIDGTVYPICWLEAKTQFKPGGAIQSLSSKIMDVETIGAINGISPLLVFCQGKPFAHDQRIVHELEDRFQLPVNQIKMNHRGCFHAQMSPWNRFQVESIIKQFTILALKQLGPGISLAA